MRNQNVNTEVGNCRILLWSVIAMITASSLDASAFLSIKQTDGTILPAHAQHCLTNQLHLKRLMQHIDEQYGGYYMKSICVSKMVNNVPPYPNPLAYKAGSRQRANLMAHINNLSELTPIGIFGVNPASNEGNCRLLQQCVNDFEEELRTMGANLNSTSTDDQALPYRIHLSDVNIYPRVLQVNLHVS